MRGDAQQFQLNWSHSILGNIQYISNATFLYFSLFRQQVEKTGSFHVAQPTTVDPTGAQ